MGKIKNILYGIYLSSVKFPFKKNKIRITSNSKISFGNNVKIRNSRIFLLTKDAEIFIDDNCILNGVNIYVRGNVKIGKSNIIGYEKQSIDWRIEGDLTIGDFNKIQCSIWQRFNSSVGVGNSNNINFNSELRADEKIIIGDFNQISYNVMIWDTNTHNIYEHKKRRKLTIEKYPVFGYEFEKPISKPVIINDDNWLGKNVTILKGSEICNRCIIAYGTLISNKKIKDNQTVFSKNDIKVIDNEI